MTNVFDYLQWRGDLHFRQAPINVVDNLIFSCLAYVVLQGIVDDVQCGTTITVAEAAEQFAVRTKEEKKLRDERDEQLLLAMVQTQRFGQLQLQYHVDQTDLTAEKQFAAITVALDDGSYFVAFRGTDYSVIGWKEDFNMTFCSGVPAQLEAVQYLNTIASCTTGPLYVGGHSKGGNLSIYAAAFCEPWVQERIVTVYNNDGPGFLEDVIASEGYQTICHKIHTFIPQTSLFGLALEHAEPITIIESTEHFVMQHDPYSWSVMGAEFIYLENVAPSGKFLDQTVRGWLAELSPQQREKFVDSVYELLVHEEADTLQEMAKHWLTNAGELIQSLRNIDEESAEIMQHTLKLLGQNILRTAATQVIPKQRPKLPAVFQKFSREHDKDTDKQQ